MNPIYPFLRLSDSFFKIFFANIKQEERLPLVFHCTAGKDRTGVAGALLLLALGVSEKKVVEDYTLSNVYRKESNELQFAKIRSFIKDENVLEAIKWMFEVKEDYIMVTLNEIKKKYAELLNNEMARKYFDAELKFNMLIADVNKIIADSVKEMYN